MRSIRFIARFLGSILGLVWEKRRKIFPNWWGIIEIRTRVLDRAAFLLVFGGKLEKIIGDYPENEFIIAVPRVVALYESTWGWVPYRSFCNIRKDLKRQTRTQAGLPAHFTGDSKSHFTFADLAKVIVTKNKSIKNSQ